MRIGLKIAMAMMLVGACGDDGVGNDDSTSGGTEPTGTTASSSTTGTGTGTTDGESSGESSGSGPSTGGSESGSSESSGSSGSSSSSGGSSTTAGLCTEVETTPVIGDGFSGYGGCEGVMANVVLDDAEAIADHNAAYCDTLDMCMSEPPPCPPPPDVDIDGNRVVYAMGSTSGCSASATISEVLDCGDAVEVHYVVAGMGMCAQVQYAWDAVVIPDGADVTFIQD